MPISVDFSQHVKEVLNRNNVQVRSLEAVGKQVREAFTKHRKKAILLIRNKVFEREINSLEPRTIDVFDTQLSPYLKKGQLVLVVLPTGGVKRYVLQTTIDNIFVDRFRLIVLDPRNNRRFSFSHPIVVKIRSVADATVLRIQTGEVRAIRYNAGIGSDPPLDPQPGQADQAGQASGINLHEPKKSPTAETGGQGGQPPADAAVTSATVAAPAPDPETAIKDLLCQQENEEPADDFMRLTGQPPLAATLLDISCGGMCLSCLPQAGEPLYVDQLLAVECTLAKDSSTPTEESVTLFLFAIVRNMSKQHAEIRCNLQFLANLPRAIQNYW